MIWEIRENDAPMTLNLPLPPIIIPKFGSEYVDWSRFHDLFVELENKAIKLTPRKLGG